MSKGLSVIRFRPLTLKATDERACSKGARGRLMRPVTEEYERNSRSIATPNLRVNINIPAASQQGIRA